MPGEVRTFACDDLREARQWVSEPAPTSDLRFELLADEGILILEPRGELEAGDFERLGAEVDPHIAETGGLKGLIIVAEHFPGWDDFSALSSHLRFVKDHHKKIRKVAFVTDDRLLSVIPRISSLFVAAETRAFPMAARDEALLWAGQD
ncbi:MAG: STAS/SEC14 domain-containing protein [Deltaproteobacteria bacterium]|nr:STAS/SEC14 domain-containing protein [Deltaproteobacteria bacterium]